MIVEQSLLTTRTTAEDNAAARWTCHRHLAPEKKVTICQSIIVQLFSFDLVRAYFGMALTGFEHRGHSI